MMIDLTLSIKLSQANAGQVVSIFKEKIVAVTETPNMGTVVICAGGVSLPVKESKAQIELFMKGNEDGK